MESIQLTSTEQAIIHKRTAEMPDFGSTLIDNVLINLRELIANQDSEDVMHYCLSLLTTLSPYEIRQVAKRIKS